MGHQRVYPPTFPCLYGWSGPSCFASPEEIPEWQRPLHATGNCKKHHCGYNFISQAKIGAGPSGRASNLWSEGRSNPVSDASAQQPSVANCSHPIALAQSLQHVEVEPIVHGDKGDFLMLHENWGCLSWVRWEHRSGVGLAGCWFIRAGKIIALLIRWAWVVRPRAPGLWGR